MSNISAQIVETLREPLLVLDGDLRVVKANRAFYRTFVVSAAETEHRFFYELGSGQWDIPALRRLLSEVAHSRTTVDDYEVARDFPGIGRRTMQLNARRLVDDAGMTIVIVIEDVSSRRAIEAQLERQTDELQRSNADLQQFAYAASHDLQEPLRAVIGYLQLIQSRAEPMSPEAQDFMDHAVAAGLRMKGLIDDLLAYARVAANARPWVPTDCGVVLHSALQRLELVMQESGAVVTTDALPTVMADPAHMTALFQNLLANAIKFHGEETPRIHVSAARHESGWTLSVRDNGIGIAPEHAERVFGVFQRLHTRRQYPGTGIGLALCRRIMDRRRGTIEVVSEPGHGATFLVRIPDATEENA